LHGAEAFGRGRCLGEQDIGNWNQAALAKYRKGKKAMENSERMQRLNEMIRESSNVVFFGGAGVSTESGIPDFRSTDGLYHQQYAYPPETILSHTFYREKPEEFFRFYLDKILIPAQNAKPNAAHRKLAQWEREGKLKAVITQNIDGLHQAAGSRNVLELHGSILRNYCEECGEFHDAEFMKTALESGESGKMIPRCRKCGGRVKPDVVLYEEVLDMNTLNAAVAAIKAADVLIIGGTSLVVYPAAGLIDYYRGNKLVLVNKSATSRDSQADLVISAAIGELFGQLD
jgi:NAD-dependent deacetylase